MSDMICSYCWYEQELIVWNVNGRCDNCGGIDWIESGPILADTQELERPDLQEVPDLEEELPGPLLGKAFAMAEAERLRNKPHKYMPERDKFFKD